MNIGLIGLIIGVGLSGGAVGNEAEEEALKEFDKAWFSEINYPIVTQKFGWSEHIQRSNESELRLKKMKMLDTLDFSDAYTN